MDDKECIRFLLGKSVDFHNRFNSAIDEIMRRGNGKEEILRLIESIRYVADDIERIIKR
jgi:hypothetical protein